MKIVVDSSCELNDEIRSGVNIQSVPLKITVDNIEYVDDENLDVAKLLDIIDLSSDVAKTSCPSPEDFLKAYEDDDEVFVVTLTSALSGTYNSARLAKDLAIAENENKKIHIFNTKAASIKETLVAIMIKKLISEGLKFDQIVDKTNEYMNSMKFFFHLDILDTLVKNGRMSQIKGTIANVFNIKLILTATESGEIEIYEKVRTEKKTMKRIVELIGEVGDHFEEKILGISYCDCFDKATALKSEIIKNYAFKEVVLIQMGGLSSTYSNRGGLILSF